MEDGNQEIILVMILELELYVKSAIYTINKGMVISLKMLTNARFARYLTA